MCIEQGLSSIYSFCDATDYNFILNPISKKCALSKGFHQFIASVMLQIIISFWTQYQKVCIEQGLSSIYSFCGVTDYNFILNPISIKVCIEQGLSSIYSFCDVTDYNFILNPISKKCALSKGFHQFIASVMLQIIISFWTQYQKSVHWARAFINL